MSYPKIELLIQQSRLPEAEAAIREELAGSMEDEYLFFLFSLVLLNQDKPKEAERAANEAIALNSDYDLGFFIKSRALLDQGNKRAAHQAIDQAIALDPYDADYFSQKAHINIAAEKYEKALLESEKGLEIDPEHEDCRIFRSISLERLGRSAEAEGESLGLLSEDPDSADSHILRGYVLIERKDAKGAERHFAEALRIFPDSEPAREGLALAYKMSNPVVGWFLKLLMWIGKFPLWIAILGVFFLMRFGDGIADSKLPPPIPQAGIILRITLYSIFVLALLVGPLFDLILWCSRSTRNALTSPQIKSVKWALVPIILALIYLVLFVFKGTGRSIPIHAVVWAALAAVIYELFQSSNRSVFRWMLGLTTLCFGTVIWVEGFTYFYMIPKIANATKAIQSAKEAGADSAESIMELAKWLAHSFRFFYYPALALWIVAAFSDNIRGVIERKHLQ